MVDEHNRIARPASGVYLYTFFAIFSGMGLIGRMGHLHKAFHIPVSVQAILLALCVCLPFLWKIALKYRTSLAFFFAIVFVLSTVIVYPRHAAFDHKTGQGTDQADAVIIAATKLSTLQWPYNSSFMWSHNPMSPGPGWVILQAPAIRFLGYGANMLLLWVVSFAVVAKVIGKSGATGLAALIALSPTEWIATLQGSDFPAFGICLVAMLLIPRRYSPVGIIYAVAASLLFQFRAISIVMPGLLRKEIGFARALIIGSVSVICQTVFLLIDPVDYVGSGPLHIINKTTHQLLGMSHGSFVVHPVAFAMVITSLTMACLFVALWIGKRFDPVCSCLYFLMATLALPAFLALTKISQDPGGTWKGLANWEGGNWLTACLPLAALLVVMRTQEERKQSGFSTAFKNRGQLDLADQAVR